MNKVEIPISKSKISLLTVGAIVFFILGILCALFPEKFLSISFGNPNTIEIFGMAAVVIFGTASFYGLKKLFDKSFGLIIDEHGITDNSTVSSVGLIEWSDITEVKTKKVLSTRFLLIFVNNPDKYLDGVSGLKHKLINEKMQMYGTPISITSSVLKYNFKDLERLIKEKLIEQKEKSTDPLTWASGAGQLNSLETKLSIHVF